MKTIGFITQHRTGSTFLTEHIPTMDKQYNALEVYSGYIPNFVRYLHIFLQSKNPLPPCIKQLCKDVFMNYHKQSKPNTLTSIEILRNLKKEIEGLDYEYFVFKFLSRQQEKNLHIKDVIDLCDYMVFSYRENTLFNYISFKMAQKTNVWKGTPNNIKGYNNKNQKIKWHKKDYERFKEEIHFWYDEYVPLLKNDNVCLIKYEEFINYDCEKLWRNILENFNIKNLVVRNGSQQIKLNNREKYVDYFVNPDEFKQDVSQMKQSDIIYDGFKNFSTIKVNA